jgi:tetratricopeptide (TPR) repeat protein
MTNRGLVEAGTALDRAGRIDTAIALYERALAQPALGAYGYESTWFPLVLRRLAELHEARGKHERAIAYCEQFLNLWTEADPELQPQVVAMRRRCAEWRSAPR